jgi:hypothetical protein
MGRLHIPNVRHWAVRIHEAAVLLAAIRPAFICLPVAVESSCRSHRSIGILPFRCTASLLSSASLLDHLTSPCGTAARLLFFLIYPPHRTSRFSVAVSGGGYPFCLPRSRRHRSLSNPNRRGAEQSIVSGPGELRFRWRCSTSRRNGRRVRTSPTGTPPSLTTTSGGCGTNSPSSSTSSSSFSPRRFVLLLLVL